MTSGLKALQVPIRQKSAKQVQTIQTGRHKLPYIGAKGANMIAEGVTSWLTAIDLSHSLEMVAKGGCHYTESFILSLKGQCGGTTEDGSTVKMLSSKSVFAHFHQDQKPTLESPTLLSGFQSEGVCLTTCTRFPFCRRKYWPSCRGQWCCIPGVSAQPSPGETGMERDSDTHSARDAAG